MSFLCEVENLDLVLSKRKVLDQITLQLHESKVTAVVGHNGAGKTTFFHVLLGLKYPTAGRIRFFSPLRLGYVPERPYLPEYETLEELLCFFSELDGIAQSKQKEKIHEAIQFVGLESAKNKILKEFSKGMLQRALIAVASLTDPPIWILDEPMSGLDPQGRVFVRHLLKQLKSQGKTILFSTHQIEEAKEVADQVLELDQGRVRYFGSLSEWNPLSPEEKGVMES